MSSSSLLERKKAQWAKEKAEEQQWFPFGKPGGGAPLKAVFGNIRQNSSDYFANSLPAQEIHFNDGNALLLRRHSSEHDLRNRSVRIHLPYGVSKINHVDFDGSSSNPIKILPFPCSKCLNNEGRLVVSLAPCATCSDSETSTTLNPSLNDCQALELTDSSKICSKIENAGCSYTPMRALSQVDLRKSKHGGNGMKFVRPASDNLPFFVSSGDFFNYEFSEEPSNSKLMSTPAEAHINHQFVTPVGDMERISPILNSENFAHKRRSYITEPKNFEDLEEKQSKCSLHLLYFSLLFELSASIEKQLEEKRKQKIVEAQRELEEMERIERERLQIEARETMANQRELNKWKKLKEIEELREKSVVESWEKARIEAAMIRKARIFQHASGSGIGETSNNSSSNAEIFDKSLNHSSARMSCYQSSKIVPKYSVIDNYSSRRLVDSVDDSSGCNTTVSTPADERPIIPCVRKMNLLEDQENFLKKHANRRSFKKMDKMTQVNELSLLIRPNTMPRSSSAMAKMSVVRPFQKLSTERRSLRTVRPDKQSNEIQQQSTLDTSFLVQSKFKSPARQLNKAGSSSGQRLSGKSHSEINQTCNIEMQTRAEPIDIQMSNLSLKSTHKRPVCNNNNNNNNASNSCLLNSSNFVRGRHSLALSSQAATSNHPVAVQSSARSDRITYKNQQEIKEKLHQIRTLMKEKQDKLQMAMSKSYHS
ncbi:hypothetical protein T4D_3787 [Trichinella pseudospiralis]|uniref:Uncharacterized protein n=1 Tax=Trichinella pseudospiralis TaxID=6337 RepID=A0A0V1FW82_TRIPS|nr:hypothetical protein T4D_3787 [Trichinella pseudospiralis]